MRPEATGYGTCYFASAMLATKGNSFEGKTVTISGSGNVAQYAAQKAIRLGAKVVTLSDSNGFIHDPDGIDEEKLAYVMHLKNVLRGRIREYVQKYPSAQYFEKQRPWGIKCDIAYEAVKQVRAVCKKPLMVKLSPNAENIVEMALRCEEAGANSLSLVNTFQAMAIDIYKRKPVFNNVFAGLSGPAVFPIALRMVYQVCGAVKIPVVGLGGIASWQDAVAFLMAGATAVQVGTANFVKPDICLDIIQGLEQFLKEQGCRSVSEIIGAARV